jgi:hypothetical protein
MIARLIEGLRFGGCIGLISTGMLVVACGARPPDEPKSQDEVGTIRAAVLSVGTWNNYVSALQPGFVLGPDKALEVVAPTTQVVDQRTLDVLGAGARVALPTTTVVSTTNVLPDGKPAADPGQTTTTSKTGDASALTLPPSSAGTRTAAGLTPLGKPDDATLGMEPMLRYWAATALYQEVQLINRYVRDAAIQDSNYEAYVVRFQVGVMPRRRDLQFDAYANLSFFTDDPKCKPASAPAPAPPSVCKTPIVLPLLAADSIEGALHSSTADQLRSYAFALSAVIQGVGVAANLDKLRETLERIAGRDLNSLLMVSRLTQNTLRIRLGAAQQGYPRYAMVPQNRFVTAVVLIPKTYVPVGTSRRLLIDAGSEMVDIRTGKVLPSKPAESDALDVAVIREAHKLCEEVDIDQAWNAILNNDWQEFRTQVCKPCKRKPLGCGTSKADGTPEDNDVLHQIWRKIASLQAGYGADALQIELPAAMLGALPAPQNVLLSDDKKDATTGMVFGGSKLSTETTCAALVFGAAPAQTIAAREVEVLGNGTQVRLAFPSLKRFKPPYTFEGNDYGFVHDNSGIHNFAAYRIMTAKADDRYIFTPKHLAQIFYIALTVHLARTSGFADSRRAVLQAARSLFRKETPARLAQRIRAIELGFSAAGIREVRRS